MNGQGPFTTQLVEALAFHRTGLRPGIKLDHPRLGPVLGTLALKADAVAGCCVLVAEFKLPDLELHFIQGTPNKVHIGLPSVQACKLSCRSDLMLLSFSAIAAPAGEFQHQRQLLEQLPRQNAAVRIR